MSVMKIKEIKKHSVLRPFNSFFPNEVRVFVIELSEIHWHLCCQLVQTHWYGRLHHILRAIGSLAHCFEHIPTMPKVTDAGPRFGMFLDASFLFTQQWLGHQHHNQYRSPVGRWCTQAQTLARHFLRWVVRQLASWMLHPVHAVTSSCHVLLGLPRNLFLLLCPWIRTIVIMGVKTKVSVLLGKELTAIP